MPGIRPFGAKTASFIRRPPGQDAKINILEGSVRSGKTWGVNAKLIGMLSGAYPDWQWPGGIGLITANSKTSATTNMLHDIFNIIGEKRYRYNRQSGQLVMFGRPFLVCGAKDEGAWKQIRGSTVGLWIADELTIYPKSFFNMALSRLSLPGSRMYGTTNPGNPYHYLKTDYLDNQTLREKGTLWSEHYVLDDNPNIEESVKEDYRRMYTGVFRSWYIEGKWCIAGGSIYKDVLTEDIYYGTSDATRPPQLDNEGWWPRTVAVDVGTQNAQVYGMFVDSGDQVYLDSEYHYSGRKESRQKTNSEYADDLINGLGDWPGLGKDRNRWPKVIVDPSAASFKVELMNRGVLVVDADNSVEDGIRRVSAMLGRKKLRINRRCTGTIQQMQTYAWNEKKMDGKEEPVKQNDDACFVAGTMIETPNGARPIEDLRLGDLVVTPLGRARVIGANERTAHTVRWNGTRATPDHPVMTQRGWIPIDAMRYNDSICESSQWSTRASLSGAILTQATGPTRIISSRTAGYSPLGLILSIARFGKTLTAAKSPMVSTFTTKMRTLATTTKVISNFLRNSIIFPYMEANGLQRAMPLCSEPAMLPLSGMDPMMGERGTLGWLQKKPNTGSSEITSAPIAAQCSAPRKLLRSAFCFVLTLVSRLPGANLGWTMFPDFARFAAASLASASTLKSAPVADLAARSLDTVYALRTEHGCYFANGALVSNCDMIRYFTQTEINDWRLAT